MSSTKKKPNNIIIEGVTGSKAYGLDTKDSDEDIRGVFVAPTEKILGLKKVRDTYDNVDPDWCYYEVGKFIHLIMKGNPTVLELLYLDKYIKLYGVGKLLVENRDIFLSNIVRHSYGGYALSQARALNARGGTYGKGRNKRFEKHSRHCLRLLYQGKELMETGTLTVRVSKERREELFEFGKQPVEKVIDVFEEKFKEFDSIKSVLPDEPDKKKINELLLDIRQLYYG